MPTPPQPCAARKASSRWSSLEGDPPEARFPSAGRFKLPVSGPQTARPSSASSGRHSPLPPNSCHEKCRDIFRASPGARGIPTAEMKRKHSSGGLQSHVEHLHDSALFSIRELVDLLELAHPAARNRRLLLRADIFSAHQLIQAYVQMFCHIRQDVCRWFALVSFIRAQRTRGHADKLSEFRLCVILSLPQTRQALPEG